MTFEPNKLEGKTIDRYIFKKLCGEGGMAYVYKAEHLNLHSNVAIKIMRPELITMNKVKERFIQEAELQYKLDHPNILAVTDLIDSENILGIVMKWVDGEDMEQYLEKNPSPLPPDMIWELFAPILDGMTHAHDQGVIHRDIKPANIMLAMKDSTITPKIADFGIAKVLSENRSITTPGSFLGTPIYVASEVIAPQRDENGEFQPADQRVDIYSLGVLLYQMVSGKLPFTETDLNSLFFVKLYKEIPSLTQDNSDISSELEKVVMKSMARDPNARYANCREFAKELERALFPQSSRVSKLSNPSSYFSQSIAESTQLSTTAIPLSQSLAIQQPFSDFGNFGNHPKDTDNSIDFVESINMLVDDGQTQHRSKIIVYLVSLLVVIGLTWFVVGVLLHTPQTEQAPFLPKQEMVTSPPKRHEERVDKIEIPAQRIDAGHSVAVRDELDVAPDKKIIPQPPPRKTARIDKLTSQKQCRSCVQSFYRQQHNELPTLGGYTDICNYTDFQKVKRRCFRSCRSSNEYFCEAYLQQPFRSNHNDLKRRPASEIPLCRNFCKTR